MDICMARGERYVCMWYYLSLPFFLLPLLVGVAWLTENKPKEKREGGSGGEGRGRERRGGRSTTTVLESRRKRSKEKKGEGRKKKENDFSDSYYVMP